MRRCGLTTTRTWDDFTREDDEGEEVAKYVSLDAWREMQQRQEAFEFRRPTRSL